MRIVLTEFTLDRLKLLAQEVFTLRLIHLRAHIRLNLPLDFKDLNLAGKECGDVLESINHINNLKQLLSLLGCHIWRVRRHVSQEAWVTNVLRSDRRFRRNWCARGDIRLHLRLDALHERFNLYAFGLFNFNDLHFNHQ